METFVSISLHHDISIDDAFKLHALFSLAGPVAFSCLKDRADLATLSAAQVHKLTRLNDSYPTVHFNTNETINDIVQVFEYQKLKPCS